MVKKNKKMEWDNLTMNKCPNCNEELPDKVNDDNRFRCECGFVISEKRYKEITAELEEDQGDGFIEWLAEED